MFWLSGAIVAEDDGEVVSATADMQGDGEPDRTESRPDDGPGEVRIRASQFGAGDGTIVLRGREPGDRFGESVAILTGPSGYAANDLFVGAPGAGPDRQGEAYVFFGPFEIPPGQTELIITADQADITLTSYWDDDEDFGRRVAPLLDITGDGFPELRVQSTYTHTDGLDYVFTQVFRSDPTDNHPNGGELLLIVIDRPCANDGMWAYLQGDALGDQAVTVDDFMRVAINFGMADPDLTRFDGDLNGDGVVDGADFELVINNIGTLGSLFLYAEAVPETDPGEVPVLNYAELAWFAITPNIIPVRPGIPVDPIDPIDPCDINPDCCDEPDVDPCDIDPCDPACAYRTCDPACDPGGTAEPPFGPCHPDCPDRFCNAGCGFDDDFNPYGKCHAQCDLLPECHPLCEPECNPACDDGDQCAVGCKNRDCLPECGGDLCHDDCWKKPCNPECGGDECDPECSWAPCIIECDGDLCNPACPDKNCHPWCGGDPYCDPSCGGHPCAPDCPGAECNPQCDPIIDPACNPKCEGGPCDPGCPTAECDPTCDNPIDPWCNPKCGGDADNDGCNGGGGGGKFQCPTQSVCANSTQRYCWPWMICGWFQWQWWCLVECDEDPECEPHEWTWDIEGSVTIVTEPNPPDADVLLMHYVDLQFGASGEATLFLTNGCCTLKRVFEIGPEVTLDVARVMGNYPAPNVVGYLSDDRKRETGAFLPLNNDDDDYSAPTDPPGTNGADYMQSGAIDGENDLLPIVLREVSPASAGGEYTLAIPSHVRVWRTPDRSDAAPVDGTTTFPATGETTLYVEGIAEGVGTLTMHWSDGSHECSDRAKLTVFTWQGPLNVPGYAAYEYTVTGALPLGPAGAGWTGATNGASFQSGQGAYDATILWGPGPTVSRAVLDVNEDYRWELEVNVVRIDVGLGQNAITYPGNPAWMCGPGPPHLHICFGSFASGNPGMTATLEVTIQGPTVAGSAQMRGTTFIEMGFIQDIATPDWHGRFEFANHPQIGAHLRIFSLEGSGPHLDMVTDPIGTSPWYDSQSTFGSQGFLAVGDITQSVNTLFNVTDSPDPRPSDVAWLTIQGQQDLVDWLYMRMEFNLYFAVRTTVTTHQADERFIQRGRAQWVADGSGQIDSQTGNHLGLGPNNTSGSLTFQIVTDGTLVPIVSGTPFNVLSQQGTYSTVPAPP